MIKLPKEYIFSKYPDKKDKGFRFDVHYQGKNIAYILTKPTKEKNCIWLDGIYVEPKFQGRGLASHLLKEVEKHYKGKVIRLKARPYKSKNMGVRALRMFYEKRGYKEYDTQNRHFKKIPQ
jgi:GNAT superfamily N-acetyltransferase